MPTSKSGKLNFVVPNFCPTNFMRPKLSVLWTVPFFATFCAPGDLRSSDFLTGRYLSIQAVNFLAG